MAAALETHYCTLAQLKGELGVPIEDARQNESLLRIIGAVSRLIDKECATQFYAVDEVLYYTPQFSHAVLIDDILSVSTLATDDAGDGTYLTTWDPTDYVLAPYNARTSSQPRPYWRIELARSGRYSFPVGMPRGIKLTACRGFCELADLPKGVEAVCLREALVHTQANVTPYGMTAGDGSGTPAPRTVSLSNYSIDVLAEFKRIVVV